MGTAIIVHITTLDEQVAEVLTVIVSNIGIIIKSVIAEIEIKAIEAFWVSTLHISRCYIAIEPFLLQLLCLNVDHTGITGSIVFGRRIGHDLNGFQGTGRQ